MSEVITAIVSVLTTAATVGIPLWRKLGRVRNEIAKGNIEIRSKEHELIKTEKDDTEDRWKRLYDKLSARLDSVEKELEEERKKAWELAIKNAKLEGTVEALQKDLLRIRASQLGGADCFRAEILADHLGVITDVSDGIVSILGYRPAELVGKSAEFLLPERARPQHAADLARSVKTGKTRGREAVVRGMALHKDGREVPVVVILDHTNDEKTGQITGFRVQMMNIVD